MTDNPIATKQPAKDPQRSVANGSAAPKMSMSDASASADARPVV